MKLATRLKALKAKGLTYEQMASKVGVSRRTVGRALHEAGLTQERQTLDATPSTVSRMVLEAVQASGLTSLQVATKAGVPPATLSRWCRGRRIPQGPGLKALQEALGLPQEWLEAVLRAAAKERWNV